MTGPSPWRLPYPRGGLTSVTVSGSTIEPVGSIILLPVPDSTILRVRETSISRERHECDARRSGHTARGLGGARIRLAHRQRFGAHPVCGGCDPVRAPDHRGGAQVPVVKQNSGGAPLPSTAAGDEQNAATSRTRDRPSGERT